MRLSLAATWSLSYLFAENRSLSLSFFLYLSSILLLTCNVLSRLFYMRPLLLVGGVYFGLPQDHQTCDALNTKTWQGRR